MHLKYWVSMEEDKSNQPEELLNLGSADAVQSEPITSEDFDSQTTASELKTEISNNVSHSKKSRLRILMKNRGKQIIFLLIILLIIAGGGIYYSFKKPISTKGIIRFKAQSIAFKIVSTEPANNQKNVAPDSPLTLNFSQPVTPQKLSGNLFITPNIPGIYSQGSNPNQIVFQPSTPFAKGTKVEVMLNGTYQSNQGSKLGANYFYGFTTALPQNGVVFEDSSGLYSTLTSALTNQTQNFTLSFGQNVSGAVSINLYKASISELLNSLIYSQSTSGGFTSEIASTQPVETTNMVQISSKTGYSNNQTLSFTENNGIFLVTASDSNNNQIGHLWLDYSDFMLLARQDDQKIVIDAQSPTNNSDIPASLTMYNLLNSVNQINSSDINGLTQIPTHYNPSADIIVASDNTSQAILPLSVVNSQGDIRTDQNLSTAQSFYAITDQPTYLSGSSIKFAGFVRSNQDAVYGQNQSPLNFYVGTYQGQKLATDVATSTGNGLFSGSFTADSAWSTQNNNQTNFNIYASSPSGNSQLDPQVASFSLAPSSNNDYSIKVNFSKKSYLANEPVTANISVTDASGNPLSNGTVDVHIFSNDYFENDPSANYYVFGNTGIEITKSPVVVQLDSSGKATFNLNVANLPNDGYSKQVSLQVNLHNSKSISAGGDFTINHQGNGYITFGPSQSSLAKNGTLIGRPYFYSLSGQPIANQTMNYQLIDTSTNNVLTSSTVTTDNTGLGLINIPLTAYPSSTSVELKVWSTDSNNNSIQALNYYSVGNLNATQDTSGAVLQDLDISGVPSNLTVGQTVTLDIISPANLHTMITMDRGRIYQPQMVDLVKGDNKFSFLVTPDLAPSFTLTFNYFENQIFHSEGAYFTVSSPAKQAQLSFSTSPNQSVPANSQTSLTLTAKDSNGKPLLTNLIAEVISANSYNLTTLVNPSMYLSLYHPLPIMTNSTSSLTSIGSGGGGRCGGGGFFLSNYMNPVGSTLLFTPDLTTDSNGQAVITFTPPKGSWIINVFSMTSDTIVGSASTTVVAN